MAVLKEKRYELHIHTVHSRCSNLLPGKILECAKKNKLDGIAITDHNSIGGALEAKKLNKDKHFEVIVGEEVYTDLGHVLVFYVKKTIPPGSFDSVLREAKRQNAITCIAHPYDPGFGFFSKLFKMENPRKIIDRDEKISKLDCVEGFNGRVVFNKDDQRAISLARRYNKVVLAGSDAHFFGELGSSKVLFRASSLREAVRKRNIRIQGKKRFVLLNRLRSSVRILLSSP